MVNKFFNLFKKVGKEELITSNPPAKEATIEFRKKRIKNDITSSKTYLIKQINDSIKRGEFSYIVHLTNGLGAYGPSQKKYHKTYQATTLLAARELRKAGFKVRLRTIQLSSFNTFNGFGELIKTNTYSKQLIISWD